MRCFIAIDISDENKAALRELQQELQSKANIEKGSVRWVRPESMHLTLKFLGEIQDEQSVEICNITKDVASQHKSFDMKIEYVGSFGGESAKVLWVGAGAGSNELMRLQRDLEHQLVLAGWPEETRRFTGHLTLCRIKRPKAGVKLEQIRQEYKKFKIGVASVESISVYQSKLTLSGPIYSILGNYRLQ